MRPLFIPLKREYYEAFLRGDKPEEYRVWGPRWNQRTCPPGREVILSLGYGKQHRTKGVITHNRCITENKPQGFINIFGQDKICFAIGIKLETA